MELSIDKPVQKVVEKVDSWIELFITMLPNMAVALVLLVLFIVLAKLGRKAFYNLFSKTSDNLVLNQLFSTVIYYTIMGLGLFIILGVLKLDKAVTSLLAGVGVVGLALGFAFQDIAANFVSGIILAFRKPIAIGDIIQINSIMGKVSGTNLRATVLQSFQGQEIYIPNKEVLQSSIYNYSKTGKRRIDLAVGISYADNLKKVEKLVLETIKNLDGIIDDDKIIFDYQEFASSSIVFNIRFWITYPDEPGYLSMRNKAIIAIKKAFDENDITIPFPIRTLDFGIKGGEKLSEIKLALNGNHKLTDQKAS